MKTDPKRILKILKDEYNSVFNTRNNKNIDEKLFNQPTRLPSQMMKKLKMI